jgi:hypothetical protein
MPDDCRSLLAESGPGTVAGVLRLLAPGGPEGFNMGAEQESVLAGQESLFTWGAAQSLWGEADDDEDEHADDVRALAGARLWGVRVDTALAKAIRTIDPGTRRLQPHVALAFALLDRFRGDRQLNVTARCQLVPGGRSLTNHNARGQPARVALLDGDLRIGDSRADDRLRPYQVRANDQGHARRI